MSEFRCGRANSRLHSPVADGPIASSEAKPETVEMESARYGCGWGAARFLMLAAGALLAGAQEAPPSQPLFDGVSLKNWKETEFAGRGKVRVEDGAIVLAAGVMTGITWAGAALPQYDYEISLEAMRVSGHDFFAGITFPVYGTHCTWINGGWGGSLVGLSSLDSMDASENETTQHIRFENNRWYRFRLRVTQSNIQAWIDGAQIIDVNFTGREVSLRPGQIDLSRPLGIASYETTAKLRKIEMRRLSAEPAARPPGP